MTELLVKMTQDLEIRNYSPGTRYRYVAQIRAFANYFGKAPDQVEPEEIRKYLVWLIQVKKASNSRMKTVVAALRFLYKETLKREDVVPFIPYPRKKKRLLVILSRGEISCLIAKVENLKHKTILMTAYSLGLRVSEVSRLQVEDIDSERMLIRIRQAKGNKDRFVPLMPTLLAELRNYWRQARPKSWLFPGHRSDRPIAHRSIQQMCQLAAKTAGLTKRITVHVLRHSHATHLLEAGTNVRVIQEILGHGSLRTTEGYTHVNSAMLRSIPDLLENLSPTN